MPRGNGTGPMGMGPMTGRAAGFCAGNNQPGFAALGVGRGCGLGRGRGGRGYRNTFLATGLPGWMRTGGDAVFAPMAPETRKQVLKNQAETLQKQLDAIRQTLADLDIRS